MKFTKVIPLYTIFFIAFNIHGLLGDDDDDDKSSRRRHRHRHRHRYLTRKSALPTEIDQPGFIELLQLEEFKFDKYDNTDDLQSKSNTNNTNGYNYNKCEISQDVFETLLKTLEARIVMYEQNLYKLKDVDAPAGLAHLIDKLEEMVDDVNSPKLSKHLKTLFTDWKTRILSIYPTIVEQSAGKYSENTADKIRRHFDLKNWRNLELKTWSSAIEQKILAESADDSKIGNEREVFLSPTVDQCYDILIQSSTIPTVCRKLLMEEPFSFYMLSHQVIYQMLLKSQGLPINQDFMERLCLKSYQEAKYLATGGFHPAFHDIFSEHVGFCGVMGYELILRGDWLVEMLGWNNPKFGCIEKNEFNSLFHDTTIQVQPLERRDVNESEVGFCQEHLNSVNLIALSAYLKHTTTNCGYSKYRNEIHRIEL